MPTPWAYGQCPLHEEGDVPDADRRFDLVLTYDRDPVVGVAACLLSRIAAA